MNLLTLPLAAIALAMLGNDTPKDCNPPCTRKVTMTTKDIIGTPEQANLTEAGISIEFPRGSVFLSSTIKARERIAGGSLSAATAQLFYRAEPIPPDDPIETPFGAALNVFLPYTPPDTGISFYPGQFSGEMDSGPNRLVLKVLLTDEVRGNVTDGIIDAWITYLVRDQD